MCLHILVFTVCLESLRATLYIRLEWRELGEGGCKLEILFTRTFMGCGCCWQGSLSRVYGLLITRVYLKINGWIWLIVYDQQAIYSGLICFYVVVLGLPSCGLRFAGAFVRLLSWVVILCFCRSNICVESNPTYFLYQAMSTKFTLLKL